MTIEPGAEVPPSDVSPSPAAVRKASPSTRAKAEPKPKAKPTLEPASELPYAQVVLDIEASRLDRAVDYLVPSTMDRQAQPGVRVQCRYDGRLVDGFLITRSAESAFAEHFEWLQKIVSPVEVLTPEIAELARIVADRYAGTLADVLRLAIPPRAASVEKKASAVPDAPMKPVDSSPWAAFGGGREFVGALESKRAAELPRALWTCLPGTDWAVAVATAMHAMATDSIRLAAPAPTRTPPSSPASGTTTTTDAAERAPDLDFDVDLDVDYAVDVDPDPDFVVDPASYAGQDADHAGGLVGERDQDSYSARSTETVPEPGAEDIAAAAVFAPEPETGPLEVLGRGALAIVPDEVNLARLDEALTAVAGPGHHVVLSGDLSPTKLYQNWMAILRGDTRLVIGTRTAMFAPVADLGLVAIWDDGDERHSEPRAPYPHAREVLALRAHQTGAAALIGGYCCTADGAHLVASRWARPLTAFRTTVNAKTPLIRIADEESEEEREDAAAMAGLPNLAWHTARVALVQGPVLVQVPSDDPVPAPICARCRKNARCVYCHGPLATPGTTMPACRWCGRRADGWRCDGTLDDQPCAGERIRMPPGGTAASPPAVASGVPSVAERLSEAFPGVKVVTSTPDAPVAEVAGKSALVIATPGAEPIAEGGYVAAILLDGWKLLGRPDLRANEQALRQWLNAAALVRSTEDGGSVVVMADPSHAPVHALAHWDPVWHARRELDERGLRHHPPAARVAELTGPPDAITELLASLRLPAGAEVLGSASDTRQVLIRVPRALGTDLATAIRRALTEPLVRVRIDPPSIG